MGLPHPGYIYLPAASKRKKPRLLLFGRIGAKVAAKLGADKPGMQHQRGINQERIPYCHLIGFEGAGRRNKAGTSF